MRITSGLEEIISKFYQGFMEGNDIKYTYFFRKIEVEGTTNGGGRISLITKLVEDTVRNL